jgi:hypothetical protein
MQEKILFVYNINSGIVNTLSEYFPKVIEPQIYKCRLCALTFGKLGMKSEWREFLMELKFPVQFLHRDEFEARYPNMKTHFPNAFMVNGGELIPFMSREEFNSCDSLEELMEAITGKIKELKKT